jgi:cytoskeleton protein RodZ
LPRRWSRPKRCTEAHRIAENSGGDSVTQQDEGQDSAEAIREQFAQLQAEMKRVMAEPPAADPPPSSLTSESVELERIERDLDDLRRDAVRLRARLGDAADAPTTAEAIAALRARIEEIDRHNEDNVARLNRAMQGNRETVASMSLRLDALARRRPAAWPVALAVLLGAMVVAAAILLSVPGRFQTLIDRFDGLVDGMKPHAALIEAPPPVAPVPPSVVAAAPAPAVPPAVQAPPPPVVAALPQPAAPPSIEQAAPPPVVAASPPAAAPSAGQPPPVSAPPAAPEAVAVAPTPAPAAAPASAPAPPPPASEPPASAGHIELHAKADTWVEVRNRQGGALISRVLRAGETWPVPAQPALVLSTGNAGGLELLIDGTPAPSLGPSGTIRRDVPLDAALDRAGHYTPDAAAAKASTASR